MRQQQNDLFNRLSSFDKGTVQAYMLANGWGVEHDKVQRLIKDILFGVGNDEPAKAPPLGSGKVPFNSTLADALKQQLSGGELGKLLGGGAQKRGEPFSSEEMQEALQEQQEEQARMQLEAIRALEKKERKPQKVDEVHRALKEAHERQRRQYQYEELMLREAAEREKRQQEMRQKAAQTKLERMLEEVDRRQQEKAKKQWWPKKIVNLCPTCDVTVVTEVKVEGERPTDPMLTLDYTHNVCAMCKAMSAAV